MFGSVIVGSDGLASIIIPVSADQLTEGNETLKVTIEGLSSSIVVRDTSIDTTAPTLTTFSPADDATAVAIGANIVLTFSEAMVARSGGTIELMTDYGSGHQSVEVFSVSDTTLVTISGNVVTIDPTSALLHSTGYHLGFNNALADTAGNAFSYTHGQYNFTTAAPADTVAPTVVTFSPADDATAVAIGANIVVTFSEAVQLGVGNIVLKTAAGAVVANYDAATSANLSISGSTLTINPSSNLGYKTGYKVEFAAGTIKDAAGNIYGGVSDYNFTTVGSIVNGTSGNDSLVGTKVADSLFGLDGNDSLNGGLGNDTLTGGLGTDTFVVAAGTDTIIDLGNGADRLTVAAGAIANATIHAAWAATAATTNSGVANISTNGLTVNLAAVTAGTVGFAVTNTGGAAALTGSGWADTLMGGVGKDTLTGGAGDDSLNGGTGADNMLGGADNDTYVVDNAGDKVYESTTAKNAVDAGGIDTVQSSLSYTLGQFVENLTLTGAAAINATGNTLANTLVGNGATNTLNGGEGNDTLTGGLGADTFVVGTGTDTITDLGNGADILSVAAGATANATTYAAWTATAATTNSGVANISTNGLTVSLAAVTTGAAGYNITNTGTATTLTGSALADNLSGGVGNDTLYGGLGLDMLIGGTGADLLYGGIDTVKDIFKFNAVSDSTVLATDKIYNFLSGTDKFDFSGIDANSKATGDQAFKNTSIGTKAANYSIWAKASGSDLIISADTDGIASTIEFQLQIVGVTKLAYADVVL